ncbi:MAG: hypothetical protein U0905_05080 [Pirellulales bacterium]
MKRRYFLKSIAVASTLASMHTALGASNPAMQDASCPECGCEEVPCRVVKRAQCSWKAVQVPIEKTVYETKEVFFCQHHPGGCLHRCHQCSTEVRSKTQLVKKKIKCGEKTEWKCVTEEVDVLVPVACPRCGHLCHGTRHRHHP